MAGRPELIEARSPRSWILVAYLRSVRAVNNDVPEDIVPPGFPGFERQAVDIPAYPVGNEIP